MYVTTVQEHRCWYGGYQEMHRVCAAVMAAGSEAREWGAQAGSSRWTSPSTPWWIADVSRVLCVIDDFTRECLDTIVDNSIDLLPVLSYAPAQGQPHRPAHDPGLLFIVLVAVVTDSCASRAYRCARLCGPRCMEGVRSHVSYAEGSVHG